MRGDGMKKYFATVAFQELKDFLDTIGTQPAGQQQGDRNSTRSVR